MKKVFLGVGHGGNDSGAVGLLVEKEVNLVMALACRDFLVKHGVEVKMSREKDENDPLTNEIAECDIFYPDLAIDIHNNAGGGEGFEAYHYHKGGESLHLAQNIEEEIKVIGQRSRGLKTKLNASGSDYFGFIRKTVSPAVIVEGAFVDNKADSEKINTPEKQKAFGIAYAKGILKTLGIEIIEEVPVVQGDKLYLVQVGAFKSKENAENLAKELKEAGFDSFIKEA
jgi:N-acetylmuramoyl-L-alanine amidase